MRVLIDREVIGVSAKRIYSASDSRQNSPHDMNSVNIDNLIRSYPRSRPCLSEGQLVIYEQEYKINRTGQTYFSNLSQKLESWMHQRVGNSSRKNASTLEIGAGTLNQLDHERETNSYDAIEPMTSLYQESGNKGRIRNFYRDIEEVGEIRKYDRIISIAVLEHITDLPKVIARSGLLLEEGGVSAHGIPSDWPDNRAKSLEFPATFGRSNCGKPLT